jgi:C-terminal peptidase prc
MRLSTVTLRTALVALLASATIASGATPPNSKWAFGRPLGIASEVHRAHFALSERKFLDADWIRSALAWVARDVDFEGLILTDEERSVLVAPPSSLVLELRAALLRTENPDPEEQVLRLTAWAKRLDAFVDFATRYLSTGTAPDVPDGLRWQATLDKWLRERELAPGSERVARRFLRFRRGQLAHLRRWLCDPVEFWTHALVDGIDPNTFVEDEDSKRLERVATVRSGLGITMRPHERGLEVTAILSGSPFHRSSDLQRGDVITAIDGHPLDVEDFRTATERIPGPASSPIDLDVARGGQFDQVHRVRAMRRLIDFTEARFTVEVRSYKGAEIGVIWFDGFFEGVAAAVERTLDAWAAGRKVGAVVLDFRGNHGGVLQEATAMAQAFALPGPMYAKCKTAACMEPSVLVQRRLRRWWGPVVVLVDPDSASAAELVAGVLGTRADALIVGRCGTYGKGTMLSVRPVQGLSVTVGQFVLVGGRGPQMTGLPLDVDLGALSGQCPAAAPMSQHRNALAGVEIPPFGAPARPMETFQWLLDATARLEPTMRAGQSASRDSLESALEIAHVRGLNTKKGSGPHGH